MKFWVSGRNILETSLLSKKEEEEEQSIKLDLGIAPYYPSLNGGGGQEKKDT